MSSAYPAHLKFPKVPTCHGHQLCTVLVEAQWHKGRLPQPHCLYSYPLLRIDVRLHSSRCPTGSRGSSTIKHLGTISDQMIGPNACPPILANCENNRCQEIGFEPSWY